MNPLRILLISHTYFPSAYRGKLRQLAARSDVQLCLAAIPAIRTATGELCYERSPADAFPQVMLPSVFSSHNILRLYSPSALIRLLRHVKPHIVHIEAEPHALAMAQIIGLRAFFKYRILFFTWENVSRVLALPLRIVERFNLSHSDAAIAGNGEAVSVLRRRGFKRSITVIPQVGIDRAHCQASTPSAMFASLRAHGAVIGFVGRLVPEKGVADLLEAFARIQAAPAPHLLLVGDGVLRAKLTERAAQLCVGERVHFAGNVYFRDVPQYLKCMDIMALPSRTTPKWKEQFGHVLVEAMACGVPVIGSDSGAIPDVIGDAGLITPEGDVNALYDRIINLLQDRSLRDELHQRGLQRVAAHYTDEQVAAQTYQVYRQLCP